MLFPDLPGPRVFYGRRYPFGYRLLSFVLVPFIRVYWRVRGAGLSAMPLRTGIIIASNHWSGVDPVMLCALFRRPVHWLAKVELLRKLRIAWFFRMSAVIPVDRDAPDDAWIDRAAWLLRRGGVFGIFPEGTRSRDGRLYRGFTGVARVAAAAGVPVVPAGIIGTRESVPKGKLIPRPRKVVVRFGQPMEFAIRPGEDANAAYRRFTDEVMRAIAALTGQAYVHEYNRRAA